jgi:DegV family protein with EDD domain
MHESRGTFAVVTDSTADISPAMAAERGIEVVPLTCAIDDDSFLDGTLTQQQFFDRMNASPRLPTTSQPPVGAFVEAYERALAVADHVVSVHISEKLSGTISAARQAAEMFAGKVHVFDSLNLSWGLAFQVMEAAAAAREGVSHFEALKRLERARERVKLIVGIDSLDNLAKGGRIGKVSALLGSILNLKVTFTVDENGAFQPLARVRGEKAALESTLEWVASLLPPSGKGAFAVGHALSEKRALWLREEILRRFDASEVIVYEAGSVICTHTGTGWGVAVFPGE